MSKKIRVILMFFMCLLIFGTTNAKNKIKKNGEIILANNDLGSITNPVKCNGDKGEKDYLERLLDSNGKPVQFRRIGHAHPDPGGNILDIYEIESHDGTTRAEIYMDMNCPKCIENKPITGFKIKAASKSKTIKYKYETQSLTAHQVYQMIVDYGFYCEITLGSPFHGEGLKGHNIPKNSIFPLKRIILSEKENNGNIATWSRLNIAPSAGNVRDIRLNWFPGIRKCSFKDAISVVENMSRKQDGGFSEWRIPTITELFSIIDNSKRHFPGEFNFPTGETLTFWTATPVLKKGTVLDFQKSRKAYYLIRVAYYKKRNKYSISFTFGDVNKNRTKEAYLLPVFSEIHYAYQPYSTRVPTSPVPPLPVNPQPGFDPGKTGQTPSSQSSNIPGIVPQQSTSQAVPKTPITPKQNKTGNIDKIPGFDDGPVTPIKPPKKKSSKPQIPYTPSHKKIAPVDKVPGFDDVPSRTGTTGTSPNIQKAPRTLNIALIPCLWKGLMGRKELQLLVFINDEIEKKINNLKYDLKSQLNVTLKIDKKDPNNRTNWSQMRRLYSISFDQSLGESDKISQFKSVIMAPENIDIIVTVAADLNNNTLNFNILKPMIISAIDNKIYSGKFSQNVSGSFSLLTNFVGTTIKKIVSHI